MLTPAALLEESPEAHVPAHEPYVTQRFTLFKATRQLLQGLKPDFGYNGFGELTFYRTYSRAKIEYRVAYKDEDGGTVYLTDYLRHPTDYRQNLTYAMDRMISETLALRADMYSLEERIYGQENWADCVIRVIEGCFSIRKDWYVKNRIRWEEKKMQAYAKEMALAMFDMWWMPPGRGLWAMGTQFIYERGGMALNNCGFKALGDDFGADLHWVMDSLMLGVGVGFSPVRNDALKLTAPTEKYDFQVQDNRESWCDLLLHTVRAFTHGEALPVPNYDLVRPAGALIRGFGGVASGPGPLHSLYEQVVTFCGYYIAGKNVEGYPYDSVMLKTDCANAVGCCVVAGNVRRSAELACLPISDPTFLDLKNYADPRFSYREGHGWMSNNSVILEQPEDFDMLGEIAKRVIRNGEPGYINRRNMVHGRIGKFSDMSNYNLREDKATGFNPCGEMPQEDGETCNVVETFPTRCPNELAWYKACEYATFYASTVSLLPTHRPETNAVIARNRRIGVGIVDFTGWAHDNSVSRVTRYMREGYKVVRATNSTLAKEAGVVESIRVTTVKPGGTTPKLAGKTPGMGYPNFHHMIRRIRVARNAPVHPVLVQANIPYEADTYSANTDVFELPVLQGPAKPSLEATLWEQAMNLVLMQREWADNAVSNTLNFRPRWYTISKVKGQVEQVTLPDGRLVNIDDVEETGLEMGEHRVIVKREWGETVVHIQQFDPKHEEDAIEAVLSAIAPLTKSVALLPQSPVGAYPQMPEEGISVAEYERRLAALKPINWAAYCGSDGVDEKFCQSGNCEIPK